ncbi:MAG: glycosyltransferase [Thermodesulfobacteriota bacterium]
MKVKRYFILYDEYQETVIRGQVVEHLLQCQSLGIDFETLFLNYSGRDNEINTENNMTRFGLAHKVVTASRPYNWIGLINAAWKISRHIKADTDINTRVIIHARAEAGAAVSSIIKLFLALSGRKARLIFDWRGEELEEYRFMHNKGDSIIFDKVCMFLKYMDVMIKSRLIKQMSDICIAVSNSLVARSMIKETYWMPGFARQSLFYPDKGLRTKVREELGLSDKVVFCYSGSVKGYQEVDLIFSLMVELRKTIPNAFLLIVTQDQKKAEGLMRNKAISRKDVMITSAAHDKVNAFLNAADIGTLIRRPMGINHYSFPTKFLEYLYAGLPIIATEAVPDIAKYIQNNQCGTVFEYSSLLEGINIDAVDHLCSLDRCEISKKAKADFSDEKRFDLYRYLYQSDRGGRPLWKPTTDNPFS